MDGKDRGVSTFFIIPLTLFFVGWVLFVALLNGQRDLTILSLLILGISFGAKLWTRMSLSGIKCSSMVDREKVFPGEKLTLRISAENSKFLPVWIQMEIPVDHSLNSSLNEKILTKESSLLWHQRTHFLWELVAQRRGFHQIGPPHILAGDLFAFFSKEKETEGSYHILVYPRLIPLKSFSLPRSDFFGIPGGKSPIQDPTYILGTRDYQHGRPSKYIHWKASARHHRLQEKVFEPTKQEKVLLAVEVGQFRRIKAEEAFEHTLEGVASLAARLDKQGYAVGLVTNGVTAGEGQSSVPVARNPNQLPAILEVLARLKMESKRDIMDILCHGLELSGGISCVYFCYEEDKTITTAEEYFWHRKTPVTFFVYQPRVTSGEEIFKVRPKVHRFDELFF